jgi:ankyrin repeat protein
MKKSLRFAFTVFSLVTALAPCVAGAQDFSGNPLMQAFVTGDYNKMEELVRHGADVNASVGGKTLLHLVSDPMVSLAVAANAMGITSAKQVTNEQQAQLMQMMTTPESSERMVPLVKWLIAHHARVDIQDGGGNTPLHVAAQNSYLRNARVFLENGASVNTPNSLGYTPFYIALEKSPALAQLMLARKPDVGIQPPGRTQYIHLAVRSGNLELIKYVVGRGADLNGGDDQLKTPYEIALDSNNQQVMDYLKSANANAPANARLRGSMVFDYVNDDRNLDRVEALIGQGANVNEPRLSSYTPTSMQPSEMTKLSMTCSPLYGAIRSGQRGMTKLLIDNGANPDIACADGRTPLQAAVERGDLMIVHMLVEKGANVNKRGSLDTPPVFSAIYRREEVLKYLVAHGAKLDAHGSGGRTILQDAVRSGDDAPSHEQTIARMDLLIKLGAALNDHDAQGNGLLHEASIYGRLTDIVSYLISKGLDVNEKNNQGVKPIHLAARSGNKDLVRLLLAHGATIEYGDPDKMIQLATQVHQLEMVEWVKTGFR